MANIQVKIQLQESTPDEIDNLGSSNLVSNASIQKTNNIFDNVSTQNNGRNMKSWAKGYLSLKDGYVGGKDTKLVDQYGYNGYVFGAVPSDKNLTVTLTIGGDFIDSIIVYGDKESNQFPTKAYRDNDPNDIIYSDDPVWAIKFDNPSTSHTITFLEWNRADYNACITSVSELKSELILDKSWIKSVESLSQSTGQPKEIYYGVTPSSGNIEIIDRNGEIEDYLLDGILSVSRLPIKIYANGSNIQTHISEDGDYYNGNLSIKLVNKLSNWDNLLYAGRQLTDATNLYSILVEVLESIGYGASNTQSIDSMLDTQVVYGENINISLIEYLKSIIIPYPYIKSGTIRETIDKICTLAQLNVFEYDNGDIKFISARPRMLSPYNILKIQPNIIYGNPSNDVIVKNRINDINIGHCIYSGGFSTFGDVIKIVVQEDSGTFIASEHDGIKCTDSVYNEVYNTNKNPFNGNTEIVTRRKTQIGVRDYYYYKTHIKLMINNETIIKDLSSVKLSLTYNIKGANTEWGNDSSFTIYRPYKTQQQTYLWEQNEVAFSTDPFLIENFKINKNIVEFDVLLYKDYEVIQSGHVNTPMYNILDFSVQLYGFIYNYDQYEFNNDLDTIESNELIQEGILSYNNDLLELNKFNIVSDYSLGISTAKITISCSNIYDINGNKQKDFSKGEILQVGDIVRVDKDNKGNSLWNYSNGKPKYWRVTGRNFRKIGVPLIDLELQEVKYAPYHLEKLSYTENQQFEMGKNGVLNVTWYKTMKFDENNGEVTLSDVAVKSDYYNGAVLYYPYSSSTTTSQFTQIILTSDLDNSPQLKCTANMAEYIVAKTML